MRIYETIREATEEPFRAGMTNEEVLAFVKKTFPHSSMTIDGIRTYRYNLRKIDASVPKQSEAKRMKAAAPVADDVGDAYNEGMSMLAFDTYRFVKDLTAAGMKTEQAEVLASSYAGLVNDQLATKDDLKALEQRLDGRMEALEHRLNARIAYAQVATVAVLSAVMALLTFFGP